MGKKAKHDDDDRISQLPDSILSLILSSLPMKDAVSTSILSTRWRYLYSYMVNLDVDFHLFLHPPPPQTVKSFTNFMDKMLFFHTEGSIERFQLYHSDTSGIDTSRVCGWISAALWRGVKQIHLVFTPLYGDFPKLPTALLFTSKTLKILKLIILPVKGAMAVPINVSLPCLKTLELERIKFEDEGSLRRLLSSCPVLQDLSISNCDIPSIKISNPSLKSLTLVLCYSLPESQLLSSTLGIVIDVPSLVYFKYVGCNAIYFSMVNMPYLVRSDVYIPEGFSPARDTDCLDTIFQGIGNVKSLHLTIDPEALPFLSHKRFVAFQNLHHLEIIDWTKKWKGAQLLEFLEFSPNLQTLVIHNVSDKTFVPMEKVPSCVAYKLKEFEVLDFDDESSLFKMATYILKNATVLEKFTVKSSRYLKAEERFRITKQLSRSSNKCQIMAF